MNSLNEHCQAASRYFGKHSLKKLSKKDVYITGISEIPEGSVVFNLNYKGTGFIRNFNEVFEIIVD